MRNVFKTTSPVHALPLNTEIFSRLLHPLSRPLSICDPRASVVKSCQPEVMQCIPSGVCGQGLPAAHFPTLVSQNVELAWPVFRRGLLLDSLAQNRGCFLSLCGTIAVAVPVLCCWD